MNTSSTHSWQQNIWFSVSLGLLGVIVGYMGAQFTGVKAPQVAENPSVPNPTEQVAPPVQPPPSVDGTKDHIRGDANAPLSLIVYSDFDCPYSKRHHPTLAQITDAYGEKVNVVYRHFPLSFHPTAQIKAEASECVAELAGNSAFWSFTDAMYDPAATAAPATKDELVALGVKLGANEGQMRDCIEQGKYAQDVKDEMQAGTLAGINGTPGNILLDNRTKKTSVIVGAQPIDAFKTAIDTVLAQ
ncbi:MAG: DsbA family protein [Candidatus Peribacteraceae bacterium]|jgi:protein-disulfide isomerase